MAPSTGPVLRRKTICVPSGDQAGARVGRRVPGEPQRVAAADELDVDVEVVLALPVPRERDLPAVGREGRARHHSRVARQGEGRQLAGAFPQDLAPEPGSSREQHDRGERSDRPREKTARRPRRGGSAARARVELLRDLLERHPDVAHALEPPPRVLAQAAREQELELAGQSLDPRRFVTENRGQRRCRARARERCLAGQHLVEDGAEAEDVAARVDAPPLRLLGRHVRHRADDDPVGRLARQRLRVVAAALPGAERGELGEPEVEELDGFVVGHHHVRRLQVAVDDPGRVRRREGAGNLRGDPHALPDGEAPARDHLREGTAGDELHRDEEGAVRLVDIEDRDDVRAGESARGLRLLDEPTAPFRVGHLLRREDLEGDVAVEVEVARPVDDSHPAFAQLPEDAEVRDRRTDHESSSRTGWASPGARVVRESSV